MTTPCEFRARDWDSYAMVYSDPHRELEPAAQEATVVHEALSALEGAGILPRTDYDAARFLAFRQAVREHFEIPWTAITPRLQRVIYAINAVAQPSVMVAAGVFCGNTFICNAGAAAGPGRCYDARDLVGVEIKPEEAERAARNVARIDPERRARIVTADAVSFVADYPHAIDLLYLDASAEGAAGKTIYEDILRACYDRLPAGALVLAHNSVNGGEKLKGYLAFVRDPGHFRASINIIVDKEGLEVSLR